MFSISIVCCEIRLFRKLNASNNIGMELTQNHQNYQNLQALLLIETIKFDTNYFVIFSKKKKKKRVT